jgi:hypothetical protein
MMSTLADKLDEIPSRHALVLSGIIDQARDETTRALRLWVASTPDGAARYTAHVHRSLVIQLELIRANLSKRLPGQFADVLQRSALDSAEVAMGHMAQEVAAFSDIFAGAAQIVNVNKAAIIAGASKSLIRQHRTSARRYGADLLGWAKPPTGVRFRRSTGWTEILQRELGVSVLRNETFDQAINRLVNLGGPLRDLKVHKGIESIVDIPEGLFRRHRHRAESIVRTESMNAANVAKRESLEAMEEEDPGYLLRWDATADSRLCPICEPLDGKTVAVGESFTIALRRERADGTINVLGEITREQPPAHPNCRCVLTSWRADWGRSPSILRTIDEELKRAA